MDAARARVLALVRRFGWNATAFQTLEPGYRYYFPSEDACVAYVDTGRAWVAAGAPIAAAEALAPSVRSFIEAADAAGRRACFFAVEERLLLAANASSEAIAPAGGFTPPITGPDLLSEAIAPAGGFIPPITGPDLLSEAIAPAGGFTPPITGPDLLSEAIAPAGGFTPPITGPDAALSAVQIGEQPVWGPAAWTETLRKHKSLREQLRRARAKGVVVRQLHPAELGPGPTRAAIEALCLRWQRSRALAPLDFLVRLELFEHAEERQSFVAERGEQVLGFAGLVPVPARHGWFLEDLIRDPTAPSGTSELLVDAAMRAAARSGAPWFTLGLAPLSGAVPAPLRVARSTGGMLYDFRGLRAFKAKLRPSAWTPIYLGFPREQGPLRSLLDGLAAFTGGGFLRFGLRSLARLAD